MRVFFVLFLFLAWQAQSLAAQTLRFAPLPLENRETVIRQFSPLLAHIEAKTGQPVRFVFHDNYDDILQAFTNAQIDLAYLGPLPYTRLRQSFAQAEPLVQFREADGSIMYRCVLAAFRGDRIRLPALKNRTLGLTQPLSTCGDLSVNGMLQKHAGFGLQQTPYRYLGTHEAVALAIVSGEVAAGGMKESIARKYAGLGLEVLASTDLLPGFVLVANRATLSPTRIAQLRQIMLTTPESIYSHWGAPIRHGMNPSLDSDYAHVRALSAASLAPPGKKP
jgi:phosphonate transport system substrate-binding protein